jgi:hypothetical protein
MNYDHQGVGPSSSPETKKYTAALKKAQAQFKTIAKTADNPAFRSKYATFEGASETLLPFLTDAGFTMPTYHPGYYGPEMGWCCKAILEHESGEWKSGLLPLINLPQERKDFKSGEIRVTPPNMQGLGGSLTYAKRQLLLSLTGAWVGEADDDGNGVGGHVPEDRRASSSAAAMAAKGMEIEAKATKKLAEATSEDEAKKVVALVKQRVLEKACPKAVLERIQKKFDDTFQKVEA